MEVKRIPTKALLYFLISAVLIILFFPRELKFKYQFYIGKPWRYGLLTAPFDFPIYKTEAQLSAEQDSILKNFKPYYKKDEQISNRGIESFRKDFSISKLNLPNQSAYVNYIEKKLHDIYQIGVLNPYDYNALSSSPGNSIMIIDNGNIASEKIVDNLFSTVKAYRFIVDNIPPNLIPDLLKEFNIDKYIEANILYDTLSSERIKEEILQNIPLATGMVQAGERIVDRGVIIDQHTHDVLRSLKKAYESMEGSTQRQSALIIGQLMLIMGLLLCFFGYIYLYSPVRESRNNKSYIPFMVSALTVSCLSVELCVNYSLFNIYILPFAILPIVTCIFFDTRSALFVNVIAILICSLIAPSPWEFILLEIIPGIVAVFSLKDLTKRSQLIQTAFFTFLTYAFVYTAIILYQEGDISKVAWKMYMYFSINFIFLLFVYALIYILEKIFNIVSNVSLVELSDINSPILQVLSESCPGTFQHSLQVSFLAAEATRRIGGNAQLARTGALYHDIGKLADPEYFTENQSKQNPHDQLDPIKSAQIIINHVNEGVKIAQKEKLPGAIIDFIRTHHGTGKTKFFLNTLKNAYPNADIDESLFSYGGPNPNTKETAVLLLADSVEAASRSLSEYTEENLRNLIEKIVSNHINDGLLKDAPITFRDIETIKEVFFEKLKTMYHTRISYPEVKKP